MVRADIRASAETPQRVLATQAALDAIAQVVGEHGPVLFFQSGGCCDGSLPMCFSDGEFKIGTHDVRLGNVGGCPFFIDSRQFERWRHTQLILDVGPGDPEGFSLAAGDGRHFVLRSRVFTPEEKVRLESGEANAWRSDGAQDHPFYRLEYLPGRSKSSVCRVFLARGVALPARHNICSPEPNIRRI